VSKTIIIAGDSWGCGEWAGRQPHYGISHAGLTKYLIDSGYHVLNLSRPGGTNRYSSDRVSDFLQVNQQLQISCAIVFQTEWLRDVLVEDPVTLTEDLTYGYTGLKNRLMSRFYNHLSQASVQYNVPVYLVGGSGDTIWLDQFTKEYPGLQISCQSLTNLILKNNHNISDPVHALFVNNTESCVEHIKKHLNNADLELLLEDIDKGHRRCDQWRKEKEYFWPDGSHPNRLGHQILFEFLKTQTLSL
jgi:lysophospholipase L1-like esterase